MPERPTAAGCLQSWWRGALGPMYGHDKIDNLDAKSRPKDRGPASPDVAACLFVLALGATDQREKL